MSKKEPIRIDLTTMPDSLPIESIQALLSGIPNDKFKIINKKIKSDVLKLTMKHKLSSDKVKMDIPIEFLEFHKIYYKDPIIPSDLQVEGILEGRVRNWDCEFIINNLSIKDDLVVVRCKESNKTIGLKIEREKIQKTKLYIDKCKSYKEIDVDAVFIWRDLSWQREIKTKINLLKLNPLATPEKVFYQ